MPDVHVCVVESMMTSTDTHSHCMFCLSFVYRRNWYHLLFQDGYINVVSAVRVYMYMHVYASILLFLYVLYVCCRVVETSRFVWRLIYTLLQSQDCLLEGEKNMHTKTYRTIRMWNVVGASFRKIRCIFKDSLLLIMACQLILQLSLLKLKIS